MLSAKGASYFGVTLDFIIVWGGKVGTVYKVEGWVCAEIDLLLI